MRRTLEACHFLGRATVGRRNVGFTLIAAFSVTALIVASCGSEPPSSEPAEATSPVSVLEPIPATALPGAPADPVSLDAAAIAVDAVDVAGLEVLLDEAGFVGGTQRQFSRARSGRRRIMARVLRFETSEGAARYLEWLRGHADEVIGDAAPNAGLTVPRDGVIFVHEPNPCCHNETRGFLAMWHDGSTVVTIEIAGEGARASDVPELLSQLDAAV
jgi:hypothetical protein